MFSDKIMKRWEIQGAYGATTEFLQILQFLQFLLPCNQKEWSNHLLFFVCWHSFQPAEEGEIILAFSQD